MSDLWLLRYIWPLIVNFGVNLWKNGDKNWNYGADGEFLPMSEIA